MSRTAPHFPSGVRGSNTWKTGTLGSLFVCIDLDDAVLPLAPRERSACYNSITAGRPNNGRRPLGAWRVSLRKTLEVVTNLARQGTLERYAIARAVAALNYIEPTLTED